MILISSPSPSPSLELKRLHEERPFRPPSRDLRSVSQPPFQTQNGVIERRLTGIPMFGNLLTVRLYIILQHIISYHISHWIISCYIILYYISYYRKGIIHRRLNRTQGCYWPQRIDTVRLNVRFLSLTPASHLQYLILYVANGSRDVKKTMRCGPYCSRGSFNCSEPYLKGELYISRHRHGVIIPREAFGRKGEARLIWNECTRTAI